MTLAEQEPEWHTHLHRPARLLALQRVGHQRAQGQVCDPWVRPLPHAHRPQHAGAATVLDIAEGGAQLGEGLGKSG